MHDVILINTTKSLESIGFMWLSLDIDYEREMLTVLHQIKDQGQAGLLNSIKKKKKKGYTGLRPKEIGPAQS